MKIATYQFAPKYADCKANLETLLSKSTEIQADVIIFPELAISGYNFVTKEQTSKLAAECEQLHVYEQISETAKSQNKIIIYGCPKQQNGKVYNAAQLCFPNAKFDRLYAKTHLFYKERYAFDEGDTGFFVINYPDFDLNIGTMICYDWRFPESARTLALKGADLIVCPANLVTNIWTKVMPARAIENKIYFAVANRIGSENANGEELFFNGLSAIYDYNGTELNSANADETKAITAEINPSETRNKSFNPINDIFSDRRAKYYL